MPRLGEHFQLVWKNECELILTNDLSSGRSQAWQKTTQVKTSQQAVLGEWAQGSLMSPPFPQTCCCGILKLLWSLAVFLSRKCIPDPLHVTKLQIEYGFCFEVYWLLGFIGAGISWVFLKFGQLPHLPHAQPRYQINTQNTILAKMFLRGQQILEDHHMPQIKW